MTERDFKERLLVEGDPLLPSAYDPNIRDDPAKEEQWLRTHRNRTNVRGIVVRGPKGHAKWRHAGKGGSGNGCKRP